MATGVLGTNARQDPRQVVNTLKKIVNWNDANLAAGIGLANYLPKGAYICGVEVEVVTAFNGATPALTLGTNASTYNNLMAAGDLNPAAAGVYEATRGRGRSVAAASDVLAYVKGTLSGASAGQAVFLIRFEGGWDS